MEYNKGHQKAAPEHLHSQRDLKANLLFSSTTQTGGCWRLQMDAWGEVRMGKGVGATCGTTALEDPHLCTKIP